MSFILCSLSPKPTDEWTFKRRLKDLVGLEERDDFKGIGYYQTGHSRTCFMKGSEVASCKASALRGNRVQFSQPLLASQFWGPKLGDAARILIWMFPSSQPPPFQFLNPDAPRPILPKWAHKSTLSPSYICCNMPSTKSFNTTKPSSRSRLNTDVQRKGVTKSSYCLVLWLSLHICV